MTSDAERREVARRLREFSKDKWPLTVGGNSATIRYAISDIVFNDKRYHSGVDLFNRLADLIEPSCDRDALLELADEIERTADYIIGIHSGVFLNFARRIRRALEVEQ